MIRRRAEDEAIQRCNGAGGDISRSFDWSAHQRAIRRTARLGITAPASRMDERMPAFTLRASSTTKRATTAPPMLCPRRMRFLVRTRSRVCSRSQSSRGGPSPSRRPRQMLEWNRASTLMKQVMSDRFAHDRAGVGLALLIACGSDVGGGSFSTGRTSDVALWAMAPAASSAPVAVAARDLTRLFMAWTPIQ